jgi:3-oxoacyl-[acyl-carrier protein] reductase
VFSLFGKTALVTGGSRGIGRSIAVKLATAGADVAVNFRSSEDQARATVEEIKKLGRRSIAVKADVGDAASVAAMFERLCSSFGAVDILVNNAGLAEVVTLFDTDVDTWHRAINTNLTGAFLCTKKVAAAMKERQWGRIISISSVAAEAGAKLGHAHYAAAKSGLLGFTRTIALSLAPFNTTANVIAPGLIETEMLRRTHSEERRRELATSLPLGIGVPEDVAHAVVFLATEEARYITGVTLDVNGGMHIR